MSQNITLLGASYTAVPAVDLPKTGGGTARFTDVTDTTAAAGDVASGKYFYTAAGVRTAGTASGGGGYVYGTIRSDATLVKSWSYDGMLVEDESVTIPSYSTTAQTLVQGGSIESETVTLDGSTYDYIFLARGLVTPVYSSATLGKGRQVYSMMSYINDIATIPTQTFSAGGKTLATVYYLRPAAEMVSDILSWNSATALTNSTSQTGFYFGSVNISTSTSGSGAATKYLLTFSSPAFMVKGSSTYLNSTYWNLVTDVRYQYVIELWRVPRSNNVINGWGINSQLLHIIDCAQGTGTLT